MVYSDLVLLVKDFGWLLGSIIFFIILVYIDRVHLINLFKDIFLNNIKNDLYKFIRSDKVTSLHELFDNCSKRERLKKLLVTIIEKEIIEILGIISKLKTHAVLKYLIEKKVICLSNEILRDKYVFDLLVAEIKEVDKLYLLIYECPEIIVKDENFLKLLYTKCLNLLKVFIDQDIEIELRKKALHELLIYFKSAAMMSPQKSCYQWSILKEELQKINDYKIKADLFDKDEVNAFREYYEVFL